MTAYANVITRRFDKTQAKAVPYDTEILLQTAQPTFRWTIEGESEWAKRFGSSYTAFKLQVKDSRGTVVYTTGIQRMPAADRKGVYSYTPPVYAGCELTVGESYTWQVTVLNAKFKTDSWSDASSLYVNTVESSDEVGKIRVAVKYFGPAQALNSADVVVEAFASPDFTGQPAARALVADKTTLYGAGEHVMNARLIGVPKGTYYIRAYLDATAYGTKRTRDTWESWGYVCPRSSAQNAWMFSPTAVTIGDAQGEGTLFDCYVEDVDTNQNGLPDAWEMVVNNGKLDTKTDHISKTINGLVVNDALNSELVLAENGGSVGAGLAAQALAAVNNAGIALLALDVTKDGSYSASLVGGTEDSSSAEGDAIQITAISLTDGELTIEADLTATAQFSTKSATSATTSSFRKLYLTAKAEDEKPKTVTSKVLYKRNLTDADWAETGVKTTIEFAADGTRTVSETLNLSEFLEAQGRPEKCFFKIVFEEAE